jgi:hypothetical protein
MAAHVRLAKDCISKWLVEHVAYVVHYNISMMLKLSYGRRFCLSPQPSEPCPKLKGIGTRITRLTWYARLDEMVASVSTAFGRV